MNGFIVPNGKPVPTGSGSYMGHNEFIVYNINQARIRYVLEMNMNGGWLSFILYIICLSVYFEHMHVFMVKLVSIIVFKTAIIEVLQIRCVALIQAIFRLRFPHSLDWIQWQSFRIALLYLKIIIMRTLHQEKMELAKNIKDKLSCAPNKFKSGSIAEIKLAKSTQ